MTTMTFAEWFEDRYGETPQSAREEGLYYLEELGDAFAAGYAAGKFEYSVVEYNAEQEKSV